MMVGVTFTGRGRYRELVPAIASRRLNEPRLWQIAVTSGFKSTEFKLEASTKASYRSVGDAWLYRYKWSFQDPEVQDIDFFFRKQMQIQIRGK